jgi:hypothetical protein
MVSNTVLGSLTLIIDIFALGTLLAIYLLWRAFWRNV